MATKIRLARGGAKKRPYYRIVVADSQSPRDGKFIEKVGTFNPMLPKEHPERITMKLDRVKYWLGTGAQPSDRVASFLIAANLFKRSKHDQKTLDARIKKSQEAVKAKKAEEEAKRKAEEAAAKEAEAQAKAAEAQAKAAEAEAAKAAKAAEAAAAQGEAAAQ